MDYTISKHEATGRLYAYYKGAFWFWDEHVQKWLLSQFAEDLYQERRNGEKNFTREDLLSETADFYLLDDYEVSPNCIETLLQCNPKTAERENPTNAAEDAQQCAPTASDAPFSPSPSANVDAQQGGGDDSATPTYSAVPTAAAEETAATPEPLDSASTTAAPVAKTSEPAGVAAENALAGADGLTSFDYSGLDDQTVADLHLAEREYSSGKKMAEMGLRRMADAVAIAHDALCGGCDNLSQAHNNQYSKDTFGAWCESIGIHRKAAERLLQVSKLMDGSSPREQKVLEELSPSLLYAAAKPSAPAELVQAVKDGDITTHKQFKELEAQLKAEREAREKAEREAEDFKKRSEDAHKAANTYHCQYEEANAQKNALLDKQ